MNFKITLGMFFKLRADKILKDCEVADKNG